MDDSILEPSTRPPLAVLIRRYYAPIAVVAVLVLLVGGYEFGRSSVYREYPQLVGIEQANAIIAKVGELIQLPTGETPTMATITDAASVKKTQPFLASAENGDVLIVYANAGEAILYRSSTNKLISVGPVNSAAAQSASSPSLGSAAAPITSSSTQNAASITTKK